jgi:hypothetical protein
MTYAKDDHLQLKYSKYKNLIIHLNVHTINYQQKLSINHAILHYITLAKVR